VLLQRAELVHSGEHADELVQALGKQLKAQEDGALIHLKGLQQVGASNTIFRGWL
jgi:hypothetical protein